MTLEQVLPGLNPGVAAIAKGHYSAFPDAVFTRGQSTVLEQAEAMAGNVLLNSQWIAKTYIATPESEACQKAIDDLTIPITVASATHALLEVLQTFTDEQLHNLSWHPEGDAFDVQPVLDDTMADRISDLKARVNGHLASGGHAKFLDHEGGLNRWHVQADTVVPPNTLLT